MTLQPTRTPRKTSTPGAYVFLGNLPKEPNPLVKSESKPLPIDPNLLTGLAAVSAAAGATAMALLMRKRREDELEQRRQESESEAHAIANKKNRERLEEHLKRQIQNNPKQTIKNSAEVEAMEAGGIQEKRSNKAKSTIKTRAFQNKKRMDSEIPKKILFLNPIQIYEKLKPFKNKNPKLVPKNFVLKQSDGVQQNLIPLDPYERIFLEQLANLPKNKAGKYIIDGLAKNDLCVEVFNAEGHSLFTLGNNGGAIIKLTTTYIEGAYGTARRRYDGARQAWVGDIQFDLEKINKGIRFTPEGVLLHELQHIFDYKNGSAKRLDVWQKIIIDECFGSFEHFQDNLTLCKNTMARWVEERLRLEINAHEIQYFADNDVDLPKFEINSQDFTLEEKKYVLNERGYKNNYNRNIRQFLQDYPVRSNITLGADGKITIDIQDMPPLK